MNKLESINLKGITYKEVEINECILDELIILSTRWEEEDSCYGYRKNSKDDIKGNRIFIAINEENKIIGYLFGNRKTKDSKDSVMNKGSSYFYLEELFILEEYRSLGIGGGLFKFVENTLINEKIDFIKLDTATKNYKAILKFYINEMGMDFWSATLFKKIKAKN